MLEKHTQQVTDVRDRETFYRNKAIHTQYYQYQYSNRSPMYEGHFLIHIGELMPRSIIDSVFHDGPCQGQLTTTETED